MEYLRLSKTGKTIKSLGQPHPLEKRNGTIARYRFVLFESLNRPETTPCHWCGYVLPWKVKQSLAMRYVVCTDFLDSNRSNHDPSNLVPSCYWCNTHRDWAEKHPVFWKYWREKMKDTPPHQRENIAEFVRMAFLTGKHDETFDCFDEQ